VFLCCIYFSYDYLSEYSVLYYGIFFKTLMSIKIFGHVLYNCWISNENVILTDDDNIIGMIEIF